MHAQHCGVQHCGSTGQAALRFESVLTNNPDPNLTNISNPNPNPNPNPGGATLRKRADQQP